jgi:hypothetical protein
MRTHPKWSHWTSLATTALSATLMSIVSGGIGPTASAAATVPLSATLTAALRVYLPIDNSGSTAVAVDAVRRIDRERQAAERWAAALTIPSPISVEVLTASDHLEVAGTFVLRSEADRTALIDAIRRIQVLRASRTMFRGVDRDLADIMRRDTEAGENFAVLFITDKVSDHPSADLRAEDLGDRAVDLGAGVSAIVLGNLPAIAALTLGSGPRLESGARRPIRTGPASAVRMLGNAQLQLQGPPALAGAVGPRLLGGIKPFRAEIRVNNPVGMVRLIRFEATAPPGMTIEFVPNPLIVPAGGAATAAVEFSTANAVNGEVVAIARLPDGRAQQHVVHIQLAVRGWFAQNAWLLAIGILGLALTGALCARRLRRTERVGDHADADRQAALAIGDTVPLATFAPDVPGALHRGWLRYTVVAEGAAIAVGGRCIDPGKRGHYRLGEDIRIGSRTFAIYPIGTAMPPAGAADFSVDDHFFSRTAGAVR